MKRIFGVLIYASIFLTGSDEFIPLLNYTNNTNPRAFNFILFVNELNISIDKQNILHRVLNKSDVQLIDEGYLTVTKELFDKGYQIFFVTYLNRHELVGPMFNHHHLYLKYPIRVNAFRLNKERSIIMRAFEALDKFVLTEKNRRPLCIVFHLPPKQLYQLEKKHMNDTTTFESRRDFSLVNLYHEIHRRRYLYPNKLLVYPSMDSMTGILINNK